MSIASGTRFGPYEISEPIGAGGMGEVYRATDTNLKRDVAIKVLPKSLANDEDRLARFQREAEMLASLNHPNIGHIYGLERSDNTIALVLELIEGPTLDKLVTEDALPIDEALGIATQIADALEAAHGQGIVHRDLKPANIKLRPDGTVKILDFGIAKALDVRAASGMSPIMTTPTMTQTGIILGSAQYMSPEQARGKGVDQRADIWAFACVLFEMLTGQPAFGGEDVTVILARILEREPNFDALPPSLSPAVKHTIGLCLRKDPTERIRAIGDVKLALAGEFETVSPLAAQSLNQPGWRRAAPIVSAAAVAAICVGLAARALWPAPEPQSVARFDFTLPNDLLPRNSGRPVIAVSPDGNSIVVNSDGIFLRTLDDLEPRMIPGTEGTATAVTLSPDGQSIAYFWPAARQLLRVSTQGGESVVLADGVTNPFGATWASDDTIWFSQPAGIFRVPANGGTPELIIETDEEIAYGPQLLPDGNAVLFTVTPASVGGRDWDDSQIVVHSLSTGDRTVLLEGGNDARYLPTGHLVFALGDRLLGVAFDPDTLTVSGNSVPLIQGIQRATSDQTGVAHYSVSENGTLAYIKSSLTIASRSLVWVDRLSGNEEPLAIEPSTYAYPRISPDGLRIALDDRNQNGDIWVFNRRTDTRIRLSEDNQYSIYPIWTPDSSRVAYAVPTPEFAIHRRLANIAAAPELLATDVVKRNGEEGPRLYFFAPDDRIVFASAVSETGHDVGIVGTDGGGPTWLLEGPHAELNAELSPDGGWLAYQSDESGQWEIYVRPFPNVGENRFQISNAGGFKPLWSRDGRELFYLEGESRTFLMSVAIGPSESSLNVGERSRIMAWLYDRPYDGRTYDVSLDGQRFLAIKENPGTADDWIVVVQNWFEELRERVPTN